jgi:hypothetical protein
MAEYLSLSDLFFVGLALDITGGILLARGLLLTPRELAMLNTMYGAGEGVHKDRCRNRVLGEFGLAYLTAGFVVQAIGYALQISGHPSETGGGRLLGALLMAAVVVALAWAAWALLSARRVEILATRADKAHPEVAKEIEEMTQTK